MPSTSPPVGPDTPAGAPLGDEAALERLFRARFNGLAVEAKKHLKDAQSSAPRIVEALFLRAWDERAQFKTVEELDAFLKSEVAHASARELARRASAHHFGGGKGKAAKSASAVINADESWKHILHTLHPDRAGAAGAVHDASRHEAAAHVKGLAKRRSYVLPVVLILAAIAASLGIAKYLNGLGREGGVVAALRAGEAAAHQTRDAQFFNDELPEGSKVKVGPGSKLVLADKFGDDMRVIQVQGIVAVTVAGGHKSPLEVRAFNAVIDAPSGSLYVRTSDADSSVTLVARDAADSLRIGKDTRGLAVGAAIHIAHDGTVREATPLEVTDATMWTTDSLSVTNESLKDVIDDIQKWYGTKIIVLDSTLLTRTVTFQAPLNSATAAINGVEKSAKVKFGYEGQAMVFRNAGK